MNLDINVGDIVLGGRYKNKRIKVKKIGTDEIGQPIINKGRKLLSVRIEKKLPEGMWSSKTLAEKYKDKDMDKKAFLQEAYDSAFNDELEKISEQDMSKLRPKCKCPKCGCKKGKCTDKCLECGHKDKLEKIALVSEREKAIIGGGSGAGALAGVSYGLGKAKRSGKLKKAFGRGAKGALAGAGASAAYLVGEELLKKKKKK